MEYFLSQTNNRLLGKTTCYKYDKVCRKKQVLNKTRILIFFLYSLTPSYLLSIAFDFLNIFPGYFRFFTPQKE